MLPAGDSAILLEFGQEIDSEVNRRVQRLSDTLMKFLPRGVIGVVPAYASLLLEYDPLVTSCDILLRALREILPDQVADQERHFRIPTCYGGGYGPDLDEVARTLNLTVDDVVTRHSGQEFRIYCLGFSPGFPYCGILPSALDTPRRAAPRPTTPAGSVGIAGRQTGVYPSDTPGGWPVIGRTPIRLFDVHWDPPIAYRPGDYLRFVPIDAREYERLHELSLAGGARLEAEPDAAH